VESKIFDVVLTGKLQIVQVDGRTSAAACSERDVQKFLRHWHAFSIGGASVEWNKILTTYNFEEFRTWASKLEEYKKLGQ
jgi:hypothetical protein